MIRIESYNTQHQLQAAIETGLSALQELGVPLQQAPPSGLTLEVLRDLPLMSDRRGLAATQILAACIHPVYVSRPGLLPVILLTTLHLTISHGLTPAGCLAIVSYAAVQVWRDDIEAAYQLGRLGIQLVERLEDNRYLCQVNTIFDGFLLPWKAHLRKVKSRVQATIQIGFETGNKSYLGTSLLTDTTLNAIVGNPLAFAQDAMERNVRQLEQVRERYKSYNAYLWTQYVAHLRGTAEEPTQFAGPYFDEVIDLPAAKAEDIHNTILAFHILKSSLHYHLGDYRTAYAHSRQAEPRAFPAASGIIQHLLPFYQSLALLQLPERQTEHVKKLDENVGKLRLWAELAPMNYQHKLDMVLAERERVAGKVGAAMGHYERAIAGAKQNEFTQDEALANELYGRFWHERGNDRIAQLYLREAHALYRRWGAGAITAHLEGQYPHWLKPDAVDVDQTADLDVSVSGISRGLDLRSVLKTAEAIAGKLDLEVLLGTIMTIIMENAGAQRACLIVERDGHWIIEAEGDVETDEVRVLQGINIVDSDQVSPGILHYVARTGQTVLLDDAAAVGQFVQDPTVQRRQVKSLLSMPLINRGHLSGILYLENNLATHIFTPGRVGLLKLLSSQMAISLDHAWLYEHLEAQVAERTHELDERVKELDCLYGISRLAGQKDVSLEQILRGTVDLLPPAWQYPEIACARLVLDGQEFKTDGFRETPWQQSSAIVVQGEQAGQVEVGYLEERPEADEGPFLEEERLLLNTVAERLGRTAERVKAEEALRYQATLLGSVSDAVITTDLGFTIQSWNSVAEALYGWRAEEAIGKSMGQVVPTEYPSDRREAVLAQFQAEGVWGGEVIQKHKDGNDLHVLVSVTLVRDDAGHPVSVLAINRDITELKRAEIALRVSEEKYRDLVEKVSDVIYAVDAEGVITYLNPAIEALIGLPPDQVVGQPFAQFVHPEDLGRLQDNLQNLLSGVAPGSTEYRVLNVSGETRWIRVTSQPIVDEGRVTGLQGVLTDMTERKRVEEQLEEAAIAAERQRLARELHDSVTQSLYGLDLFANATQQTLSAGRIERATEHVQEILNLSHSALADMRLLIFELRPPLLEQEGLAGALRVRLESVEGRAGLKTKFEAKGERPLSPLVEAELYAVALEALNNALKHAQAEHITLNLECDEGRSCLTVQDDGIGYDPEMAKNRGGIGLHTMRERVERLGGNLTLETAPGRGTTVRVEVTA